MMIGVQNDARFRRPCWIHWWSTRPVNRASFWTPVFTGRVTRPVNTACGYK